MFRRKTWKIIKIEQGTNIFDFEITRVHYVSNKGKHKQRDINTWSFTDAEIREYFPKP